MIKKQILISLILIVFLIGGFLFYKNNHALNFKCNSKSKCIDGPVTTGLKALEDFGFKLENDYLAVKIDLPKDDYVKSQILLNYEKWKQENNITATSTRVSLMLNADIPEMRYTYNADYTLATTTNTVSYIFDVYTFTGGAHGSSYKLAFTFQDRKLLKIEDILPQDKLKLVADLAFKEISKVSFNRLKEYSNQSMNGLTYEDYLKDKESLKWIKEGTAAKRGNYNTVWLDGDDMIIYFGQYQVWSYAEGDYELRIPIINLK